MKSLIRHLLIIFIVIGSSLIEIGDFNSGNFLLAQGRKRSAPQRLRKPRKRSTTADSGADISQLEERNREFLRQIVNLQNERDFYKKKLLEWSEAKEEVIEKPQQVIQRTIPPVAYEQVVQSPAYVLPPRVLMDTIYVELKPKASYEDSLIFEARRFSKLGNYDKAIEVYELLLKSNKCKDIHRFYYGTMLYKLGDYTKALEVLNTTAGSDSLVSIVSFYKGRIYQRTGLYQVALMEFFRSKMLNPSFAGYAISLGFQYLKSNQLDSAEVLLKSQLNVSQNLNAEIFAGLAEVERLQGERLRAINLYQKSLACDPTYMNNNFMLGKLLLEEKQYQSSILFLSRSLKYNREQENHHLYLGKAFYFLRQWDRALSGFLKIGGEIDKSQWIPKLYYVKSLIEYERGNFHEATNLFRRAKEWNPDASLWMSEALQDLGEIYENEANYNDALGYYSQLIRINPSDSQSMLKLGTLYYQVGDIGEARIAFMNALRFERTAAEAGHWLNQIDSVFE